MKYNDTYKIGHVNFSKCSYKYVLNEILLASNKKINLLVVPIAAQPLYIAEKNKAYRRILNSFDLVLPDSQYIRLLLNLYYKLNLKNRVYGPTLFHKICRMANKRKITILLYGNYQKKLIANLKTKYPNILLDSVDVTGIKIKQKQIQILEAHIKDKNQDIIIIGLGSPLQHYILSKLKEFPGPVVAVGAAFDFVSGEKSQAPELVGNIGFEWLYRLIQEPKRLSKRYFLCGLLLLKLAILGFYNNFQNETK